MTNSETEKRSTLAGVFVSTKKLWVMRSRMLGLRLFLDQMVCPVLIIAPPPIQ